MINDSCFFDISDFFCFYLDEEGILKKVDLLQHKISVLDFKKQIEKIITHDKNVIFLTKTKELYFLEEENLFLIDKKVIAADLNKDSIIYTKLDKKLSLNIFFLEENHLSFIKKYKIREPVFIKELFDEFASVSAGNDCWGFVENGEGYVFGDNFHNELINNTDFFIENPIKIQIQNLKKIFFNKKNSKVKNETFYLIQDNCLLKRDSKNVIENNVLNLKINSFSYFVLNNNNTLFEAKKDKLETINSVNQFSVSDKFICSLDQSNNLKIQTLDLKEIYNLKVFENKKKLDDFKLIFFKKIPNNLTIENDEDLYLEIKFHNPYKDFFYYKWFLNKKIINFSNKGTLKLKKELLKESNNILNVEIMKNFEKIYSMDCKIFLKKEKNNFKIQKSIKMPVVL